MSLSKIMTTASAGMSMIAFLFILLTGLICYSAICDDLGSLFINKFNFNRKRVNKLFYFTNNFAMALSTIIVIIMTIIVISNAFFYFH